MEWRRAKAVIGYIDGKPVIEMAGELGVVRSAITVSGSAPRWPT
jgi:hypothetical protein